ncbi:MFS transporter [Streptomyces anulatus]|uniref:MFS transporter n=1 Tax=Streptomyces anulatus TaxID=1892 RepID=UPI002E345982|nr:MFS transporter [Streptomyces anulatus]
MTASTPASAGHAQQQNRRLSLRDHRGFRVYWLGEATSRVGSSLYAVALPVIAAVELDATPGQVSTLASAVLAPVFVLALPAGVLGDRYSKRDLMMGTDLLAAAVVATVPVCWATGMLSMPVLYVVGLLLGTLAVLHQAAAIAIVPELVEPALLHRANSRVMAVFAMAGSAGTFGGTAAVSLLGATRCLLLDSASYLVSAWWASQIPPTPVRRPNGPPPRLLGAIREGVAHVMRDRIQRPLVLMTTLHAYAEGIAVTYFAYYLLTELGFSGTGLGLVMGAVGTGTLVGALAATRLERRAGPGTVLLVGFAAYPLCGLPLVLAPSGSGSTLWLIILAAASALQATAATAAGSTQRTLRQRTRPPDIQSRVQQTSVWLVAGARLLAALSAGAIAHAAGLRAALVTGITLLIAPVVLLWASPVRRLASMPTTTWLAQEATVFDSTAGPAAVSGLTASPYRPAEPPSKENS